MLQDLLLNYPFHFKSVQEYIINHFNNLKIIWQGRQFYEQQLYSFKNDKKSMLIYDHNQIDDNKFIIVLYVFYRNIFHATVNYAKANHAMDFLYLEMMRFITGGDVVNEMHNKMIRLMLSNSKEEIN